MIKIMKLFSTFQKVSKGFQKVLQTQYNFKYIYEMACDQNPRTATEQF